jgi:hypothetical protein
MTLNSPLMVTTYEATWHVFHSEMV